MSTHSEYSRRLSVIDAARDAIATAERDARDPSASAREAADSKMIAGGASIFDFAQACCGGEVDGAASCYVSFAANCSDPVTVATVVKALRDWLAIDGQQPDDDIIHEIAVLIEECPGVGGLVGVTESDHDKRVERLWKQVRELRARLRSVAAAFAVECANTPIPPAPTGAEET